MSDKEARALGAGSTITVDGAEYTLSPVKLQQLSELQRTALKYYKNEYLATYRDNLDMIPKEKQERFLEKKLDEVARWDIDNLPAKKSYSAENITLNDKLRSQLKKSTPQILTSQMSNGRIYWLRLLTAIKSVRGKSKS